MNNTYVPLEKLCRNLIIDTDIGPDCDDAGAIALACRFSVDLGFKISAVINCTSNPFGNGAADAIMGYCGISGVPQGRFCRRSFLEDCRKYNEGVAKKYSKAFSSGNLLVEDALEVYRKVLREAEDKSVTVVTIGPLNTLAEILQAEPKLCEEKIYSVVSMAGSIDKTVSEYNVACDVTGAECVFSTLEKLGIPQYLISVELGGDIITGFSPEDRGEDPVRDSYRLYTDGRMRRNSWDLIAVHFAVIGEGEIYGTGERGTLSVFPKGEIMLSGSETGNACFVCRKVEKVELENILDRIIAKAGYSV
ncbi:MAG: nucleoside hydrolase [Clostridia bacterium]|nr:nucleoside hydrolase [Clostridia bacterium]